MLDYYAFLSLDMVMPDQVEAIRKSQEGVVGWRYRPEKHILELLFDPGIKTEQGYRDAIASGQTIHAVPRGQRMLFHLPTHLSILEEIADAAEALVENAEGTEECFDPSEFAVPAEYVIKISELLKKLIEFDEQDGCL